MRVRTYGFPGCFTRPPGTSTRNHPHEPTTSKPVVPGDVLPLQCTLARWMGRRCARVPGGCRWAAVCWGRRAAPRRQTKRDAVPGRLRNPLGPARRPFLAWWRGLTPRWPRSLRLGSASGFNVARRSRVCNPPAAPDPARCAKKAVRCSSARLRGRNAKAVRPRLNVLPQCRYGEPRPVAACALARAGGVAVAGHLPEPPDEPPDEPPGENPFGEQPRRSSPVRSLRKRIGSALAAIVALVAKFGVAIKALLVAAAEPEAVRDCGHGAGVGCGLQPVLRLGVRGRLRGAAVRARDGPRDRAAPRGHQGERADVHPLHGRGDLLPVAGRQRARRGARRARRPDPRQPRRGGGGGRG